MISLCKILNVSIGFALTLIAGSILLNIIPWFSHEGDLRILGKKTFVPGEAMKVEIDRSALIDIKGKVTRELIRLHEGTEEEVWKVSYNSNITRGRKKALLNYVLPSKKVCPHLEGNTYIWKGIIEYKPLGLTERIHYYQTETFNIITGQE